MTPERDDKNELLRQRRAKRRQAEARRRRMATLRLVLVIAAPIMAAALIIWVSTRTPDTPPADATTLASETTTAATESTPSGETGQAQPSKPDTVIHIAVGGDLNVTDEVLDLATNVSGYNFSNAFLDVAPVLGGADLSILNFEGTLAGSPYGTQTGSAPAELVQALADIGVDVLQTANSASIRAGVLGLQSTIAGIRNAGITPVGTFADSDAFRRSGGFTMIEVNGIRVALVAFTKGMDNLGLPEGSEDCVNLLYEDYTTDYKKIATDEITDILRDVAAVEPDITIAMVHWGSEYNENISDSQKKVCTLLQNNGVDAIIGTHSHLLQPIEYDREKGTLVAWSLGDFYGNATEAGSNYSVILDLEITLDGKTNLTTITNFSTTPIYTLKPQQSASGGQRVVQLEKAISQYEDGYIGRVTDDAYSSLTYALTRVEKRIQPVETEKESS